MTSHAKLKIGTRASPMARAMAESVKKLILRMNPHINASILPFVAEGDKIAGALNLYGGKGTFIKDLEQRLLSGEVDCAVHSLKDIPGDLLPHEDLALIAFLTREDPRDALILRKGVTEDDLRDGGLIGTSAPRRCAALKRLYPNVRTDLCRGNVNSRLRKLDEGQYDAIVLSYAGLVRLGFADRADRIYSTDDILPAIGQGIISLQVRKADIERCPYLKMLSNREAEMAATAERALLFRLQGNCHSAIAGHCALSSDNMLHLRGQVFDPPTGRVVEAQSFFSTSASIEQLSFQVADDLIAQGADAFIQSLAAAA